MDNKQFHNECHFVGKLVNSLVYSHEFNGKTYYSAKVATARRSGYEDQILMFVEEGLLDQLDHELHKDDRVDLKGFLVNSRVGESKDVSVVATEIQLAEQDNDRNMVEIAGEVINVYDPRELDRLGKVVQTLIVKINIDGDNSTTIKLTAWNKHVEFTNKLEPGAFIHAKCRLESKVKNNACLHEGSIVHIMLH